MNIKILASIGVFAFLATIVVGILTIQSANAENAIRLETSIAISDTVTTETKSTSEENMADGTRSDVTVAMAEGAASNTECNNQCYVPNSIKVAAGTTVTWENVDSAAHTVTAADGSFDSGLLMSGKAFSHQFDVEGTFNYACTVHPWMKGMVTVG